MFYKRHFKLVKNNCSSIRFRRFAHKAYSVFASLGKVVSIGQLSVDVSDCSVKTLRKKFQAIFLKAQNFTGQGFDFEQFTEGFDILNPCFAVVLATNNKSENYKASGFNIFLNKKPFAVFAEGFLYL